MVPFQQFGYCLRACKVLIGFYGYWWGWLLLWVSVSCCGHLLPWLFPGKFPLKSAVGSLWSPLVCTGSIPLQSVDLLGVPSPKCFSLLGGQQNPTAELDHPSRAGHSFIRALLTPSARCPFCGELSPCPPLCCVPTRVPSPPTPQSSRGHGKMTRTALSLLKLFSFSPFLFFHPFFCLSFFFFSPLPLSIPRCAPRLCELEGRPDKKLVFLSDPFTNHPSASSSPPHSPRRFTGSPGESAGISIFNKEPLRREGSGRGGGQGNSSQSLARPWPGRASVGLAPGGNPKKHQGAVAQTYFKPITTNHLILWWHCSCAHV